MLDANVDTSDDVDLAELQTADLIHLDINFWKDKIVEASLIVDSCLSDHNKFRWP